MLEITIKDTETGKVLNRTTKMMTICAQAEEGVYALVLGRSTLKDVARLAWAMGSTRDAMLNQEKKAEVLYRLRDMLAKQTGVRSEMVDLSTKGNWNAVAP